MAKNNIAPRTTTISLDEYSTLVSEANSKEQVIGSLNQSIRDLRDRLDEKREKENATDPLIKVIHYNNRYNEYDDETWEEQCKTEFLNLSAVQEIANKKAKKETDNKVEEQERLIKQLRDNVDTVQDKVETKDRQIMKLKTAQKEELIDITEAKDKAIKKLEKAYNEDVNNYKEVVKDLKEEIKKIKENKTDVEVEEKRNAEIKDLKVRIKDLERIIAKVNASPFYKRWFVLHKLELEQNKANQELKQRENDANNVGTTWVRDNEKVRQLDSFGQMLRNKASYVYQVFSASNW